jgi:hypothetical protein
VFTLRLWYCESRTSHMVFSVVVIRLRLIYASTFEVEMGKRGKEFSIHSCSLKLSEEIVCDIKTTCLFIEFDEFLH